MSKKQKIQEIKDSLKDIVKKINSKPRLNEINDEEWADIMSQGNPNYRKEKRFEEIIKTHLKDEVNSIIELNSLIDERFGRVEDKLSALAGSGQVSSEEARELVDYVMKHFVPTSVMSTASGRGTSKYKTNHRF